MQMKPGTILHVAILMCFLWACAQSSIEMKPELSSSNPLEEVNQLGTDVAAARNTQINVLSPGWFEKAENSYFEAKSGLESGMESGKVLQLITTSKAQLHKASETAKLSRSTLADAIESRRMARKAGATEMGKDYIQAEKKFLDLTRTVEKNDLRQAKSSQPKVSEMFRDLEVRAIKDKTIGEARRLIEKAHGDGTRKIAPQTYAQARKKLEQTDAFISANPHDKEVMPKLAAETLFQAKRLHVISKQSIKFKEMHPEAITLWMENALYKIGKQSSAPDMRNQAYDIQVDNILGLVKAMESDRQFLAQRLKSQQTDIEDLTKAYQAQTDALNKRIALLEGKTKEEKAQRERLAAERLAAERRLEEEKRFQKSVAEVQDLFTAKEAEVYKKGGQMVIRLKGMHFPVGQGIIMPRNYPLLTKVQRAIRTFKDPDVVIEGHTDSTGSDEVNEYLSQQRAEAVRQYLVANQTIATNRIMAVGYGSLRPVASNATTTGRAQNRRIDVLITPQKMSLAQ
jgi:outer membrane protein OmpA-like peptidoglycan-associated protein